MSNLFLQRKLILWTVCRKNVSNSRWFVTFEYTFLESSVILGYHKICRYTSIILACLQFLLINYRQKIDLHQIKEKYHECKK